MKILLVDPSAEKVYGNMKAHFQMHMGLAYIGAVLEKNGYTVELADIDAEGIQEAELAKKISEEGIGIVGITVTTPTLNSAANLAKTIKASAPSAKIVFGGMHPSVMPDKSIMIDDVDFVIKGEGEITFLELVKAIEKGIDLSTIDGLVYKENGKIIINKDRELIDDLDSIPFPARHLFKNKDYTYPDSLYRKTAPMITSRGCPGRCTYCNAHSIFGRKFRARSSQNVADEIEFLVRNMGIKEIHIWDDNFVTRKSRIHQLTEEILKRNLKVKFAFPNGIRADYLDRELLQVLKDMGTYSIAIGVESGNQEVLRKANKGIKLDKIEEAFRLAKEIGLETWAFFMIGLPGDDQKTIEDSIDFARRIDPDIAKFHILKPYPGTEVYGYLSDSGLLSSDDFENYGIHTSPVHRLERLSEDQILDMQKKAYADFYLRPGKIIRQILRIKSTNRFKLNLKTGLDVCKLIFKDKG